MVDVEQQDLLPKQQASSVVDMRLWRTQSLSDTGPAPQRRSGTRCAILLLVALFALFVARMGTVVEVTSKKDAAAKVSSHEIFDNDNNELNGPTSDEDYEEEDDPTNYETVNDENSAERTESKVLKGIDKISGDEKDESGMTKTGSEESSEKQDKETDTLGPDDEVPSGQVLDMSGNEENGYPLVDNWPAPIWSIPPSVLASVMNMLQAKDRVDTPICDKSTANKQVRMAMYGSGFGASVMNMVANSIYAHFNHRTFLLVSRQNRPYDPKRAKEKINQPNVIGALYEKEFAFPKPPTLCMNFTTACPEEGDRDCRGPSWSPLQSARASFVRLVQRLARKDFNTYMRLRTEVMRFLIRMKHPLRKAVDARLEEVIPKEEEKRGLTIGIHLRRGDKYLEAPPTPAIEYVRAGIKAWRAIKPHLPIRRVIIATDDPAAAEKIVADWNSTQTVEDRDSFIPSEGFIIRGVAAQPSNRPDRLVSLDEETLEKGRQGLIELLVDLKLLITSDVFVGTQSSNFSLMVCYMRGGYRCFNAEAYKHVSNPYVWDHLADKMT